MTEFRLPASRDAAFRIAAALAAVGSGLVWLAVWHPAVPPALRWAAGGLLLITAARPFWGLLVAIAATPVALQAAAMSGAPFGGAEAAEMLVVSFLAAASGRAVFERASTSRLFWPASVMATILTASAGIQLLELQWAGAGSGPGGLLGAGFAHLTSSYFVDSGAFDPLHPLLRWLETLWLAVLAEQLVQGSDPRRVSARTMFLAGATAAAAFALVRLVEIAARTGAFWSALAGFAATQRINPHFADLNAAGSYYAMATVVAVVIAMRRASIAAVWPAVFGLAGLWLTGSRAALAAGVVAAGVMLLAPFGRGRRGRWALGVAIAVLSAAVTFNPGRRQATATDAALIRFELTRIAARMALEHPVTGIGLGRFQPESVTWMDAAVVARFPSAAKGENAHNNYLQILVELGGLGLLAFLWLLGPPAALLWRLTRGTGSTPEEAAWACGLLAFLLTCVVGHPLLTPQVLFAFGLALGLSAGAMEAKPVSAVGRRAGIALVLLAVLFASLPGRLVEARRNVSPSARPVGGAALEDLDGVPHVVTARARWWLEPGAAAATIQLRRREADTSPCVVSLTVDGVVVAESSPAQAAWSVVRFALPPGPVDRARNLELRTAPADCLVRASTVELAK